MSVYDIASKDNSPGIDSARSRFLVNVFSNAAYLTAQTAATLWLTPFLIGYLGIAAFGIIALTNSIVSYMSILTNALYSAVSRFLSIDLEKGDILAANKTFNTALLGLLGVIVVLCPVVLAISLAYPALFDVPAGWEKEAGWLFAIVSLAFFVAVIGSNFAVSTFFHSRFLLSNITNFGGLVVRIGFIFTLFSIFRANLWYVGGGILAGAVVSLLGYVILWRKLTPELHIRITAFDRSRLQSLMRMGGWVVVNLTGTMLLCRVDLVVINAFFGAATTGSYGAVVQLSFLMEYLVSAASNVIRPIILIKYAQKDYVGLRCMAIQANKLLGLALALPVGLLCGFSRPILRLWLGSSFEYLSVLLIIIVSHQSLNLSVRPMLFVQNAFNKVRSPGIITLLSGGANLALAILFAVWGKWGAAGVAVAGAIVWTFRNAIYIPVYTAHIMKLPWWKFLPSLLPSLLGTLFVWMASYGLTLVRLPDSWFTLVISAAVVSLAYAVVIWTIGLGRVDKQLLKNLSPLQATGARSVLSAK